ncbi:MAG: class I SAM-dependent methyltransferase [Planctomycetota bacterium]
MPDANHAEAFAWNQASWDLRAPVHAQSRLYTGRANALRAGKHTLTPLHQEGVGDLNGKAALHLQCHLGMETMSLARLGASPAVGLDFSQASINHANKLRDELGVSPKRCRFVCANVYDAPEALGQAFDLLFVSEGSLCWLPDIRRWAQTVGALLKPGGRLFVHDFHPILHTLAPGNRDSAPGDKSEAHAFHLAYGYLGERAMTFETDTTYTESDAPLPKHSTAEWVHPIGAMLGGLLDAGLVIDGFEEHPTCCYQALPCMVLADYGRWAFPEPWAGQVPCEFSLRAHKA